MVHREFFHSGEIDAVTVKERMRVKANAGITRPEPA